jgi:hypothetical protein
LYWNYDNLSGKLASGRKGKADFKKVLLEKG